MNAERFAQDCKADIQVQFHMLEFMCAKLKCLRILTNWVLLYVSDEVLNYNYKLVNDKYI